MKTLTIVIQEAPYRPGNRAWNAVRFAGAALAEDMEVRLHLLEESVSLARPGLEAPEGMDDVQALLVELMECGLHVRACGRALDTLGIGDADLLAGVERGSMKALAAWVKDSDHVMVF